jgi:hypothetical protein
MGISLYLPNTLMFDVYNLQRDGVVSLKHTDFKLLSEKFV